MTHLILIRHSQTQQQKDVNAHQWQLTDTGRERCQILAAQLRPYAVSRIFTSEEPKASLTGQLVADVLCIPCETAPDLHETRRETVGYFEHIADFQAAVEAAMLEPDRLLFGEETFTAARTRLANQIDSLLQQYANETLAIVSHGTVLALYLARLSGNGAVGIWQSLAMPAYAVIDLPEKTVSKIVTSITQEG